MYSEVFSFDNNKSDPDICKVQVGLSPGIPFLSYFGDVHGQYSKTREKIPFIFSFVGRKLPSRKIRINFSSNSDPIKSSCVDLAVVCAIYLASNNLRPSETIYAIGEVEMDGQINNSSDVSWFLWMIEQFKDDCLIFIPKIFEHFVDIFEGLDIVPIGHISDLFGFFEGNWEWRRTESKVFFQPKTSVKKISYQNLILSLDKGSVLLIDEVNMISSLKKDAQILTNRSKFEIIQKLNIIVDKNASNNRYISIQNIKDLNKISSLLSQRSDIIDLPIFIEKITLEEIDKSNKVFIYNLLENQKVFISLSSCQCGSGSKGKCICSIRELYSYKAKLNKQNRSFRYLIEGLGKNESSNFIGVRELTPEFIDQVRMKLIKQDQNDTTIPEEILNSKKFAKIKEELKSYRNDYFENM